MLAVRCSLGNIPAALDSLVCEGLKSQADCGRCRWRHGRTSSKARSPMLRASFSAQAASPLPPLASVSESGQSATASRTSASASTLVDQSLPESTNGSARRNAVEAPSLSLPALGDWDKDNMVYREVFNVRCYEVGVKRAASMETIANFLQEAGCNHALAVGFSTDGFATTPGMRARDLIWVTTRMHVEMSSFPVWGEAVEVLTWFQSEGRLGARRDWFVKRAATGELIGRATSKWVMMDSRTRRVAKIPDNVRAEIEPYCPDPPRYGFPEHNGRGSTATKVPKLEVAEHAVRNLRARHGDLDMNAHVNNVTYISWMMESIPHWAHSQFELAAITLEFRCECSLGDPVESLAAAEGEGSSCVSEPFPLPKDLQFLHLLRHQKVVMEDGQPKELNRGCTVWRRKRGSR